MSSTLIVYGVETSPPVRSVLLTLKALDLSCEFRVVNLQKGEQKSESFKRLNILGQVPVLDDNGTIIVDSHCICTYLVEKYGKEDHLYPKDLAKRALVNARLYFEAGNLMVCFTNIIRPLIAKQVTVAPQEKVERIYLAYEKTEAFLTQNKFIAGDQLTIADFTFLTSIVALRTLLELDAKKFPKILEWLDFMTHLSYYEETNGKGVELLNKIVQNRKMDKTARTKPAIIYFTQA